MLRPQAVDAVFHSLARQASIARGASAEGLAVIQSKPDAQARECDRNAMGAGSTTKLGWRDVSQGERGHTTLAQNRTFEATNGLLEQSV